MGAGAGYTVEIDGIDLDLKKFRITNINNNIVTFDVPIKKGIVDYWKAESYYEGVDSDGIYYDGVLVLDYDKYDKEIDGGIAHCWLDLDSADTRRFESDVPTSDEIEEYILENMQDNIDISWMYGGGWSHANLDLKGFTLGGDSSYRDEVRKDGTYDYSYEFCVDSIEIVAPNIAENVNWYFENCDNFEEIFFGSDEE